MEESRLQPLDYLSVIRRRKWWLILPLLACITVGALLVLLLPKEYRSSTTIGITAPSVSADLVRAAATLDRDERIRAISQQLLSREVLERVVRAENPGITPPQMDTAVWALRNKATISLPDQVLTTPDSGPRLDSFILSYSDSSPERAQRITQKLAEAFAEENSKTRNIRAEETSQFLANQLKASQQRLNGIEARLRQSKEVYIGRLPEQTQANLQIVSGLRQQQQSTATALRGEQDRLSMIERQIEGMKQGTTDVALPRTAADGPMTSQGRVIMLRRQLAETRAKYTDKHPEVQRLNDELAQAQLDSVAERQRPPEDRLAELKGDPAYRQLLNDREMARIRIAELQRAETQARAQIATYQSRIEAAPMVEQQLQALTREYELEKQQYNDLSNKHQAAVLAEDLERKRGGEQFTVLYPASYPLAPSKPDRGRIMLMSIVLGLVLGAGSALGREYLDPAVHDARALEDLDIPVLAEIPHIDRAA